MHDTTIIEFLLRLLTLYRKQVPFFKGRFSGMYRNFVAIAAKIRYT